MTEKNPIYVQYYALNQAPFSLITEISQIFLSNAHNRALAYLRYGIEQNEGFIVLTGLPGTGKTTLTRVLRNELQQARFDTLFVDGSKTNESNLLDTINQKLQVITEPNESTIDALRRTMLLRHRKSKRLVLFIEETHRLSHECLALLNQLVAERIGNRFMLQVVLIAQESFRQVLHFSMMEAIRKKVVVACHLDTLSELETKEYVLHRLRLAGWNNHPIISNQGFEQIFHLSKGIPRRINLFCDRLFLFSASEQLDQLDEKDIKSVTKELLSEISFREQRKQHLSSPEHMNLGRRKADQLQAHLKKITEIKTNTQNDKTEATATLEPTQPEGATLESILLKITEKKHEQTNHGNSEPETDSEHSRREKVAISELIAGNINANAQGQPSVVNGANALQLDPMMQTVAFNQQAAEILEDLQTVEIPVERLEADALDQSVLLPESVDEDIVQENSTQEDAPLNEEESTESLPQTLSSDTSEHTIETQQSYEIKNTWLQILLEAWNYYSQPALHNDYEKAEYIIPHTITDVLAFLAHKKELPGDFLQQQLNNISENELRTAVTFFIRRIFFAKHNSHYRRLGLNNNASWDDVKKHYRLLFNIFQPDLAQPRQSWKESPSLIISEAYNFIQKQHNNVIHDEAEKQKVSEFAKDNLHPLETLADKADKAKNTTITIIDQDVFSDMAFSATDYRGTVVESDKKKKHRKSSNLLVSLFLVAVLMIGTSGFFINQHPELQAIIKEQINFEFSFERAGLGGSEQTPNSTRVKRDDTNKSAAPLFIGSGEISELEINQLAARFSDSYQNGKLDEFMSIFSKKAQTNDRNGKSGIRKDYAALFGSTKQRSITLSNLIWRIEDYQAIGTGDFHVKVLKPSNAEFNQFIGQVEIHLEKNQNKTQITGFYHSYDKK
ncbi:MAG: AAA family ATPase [Gammaproteobacteria bacterium]|nr:AAA family ATPase [Gammaproteobacteria bacterium]